jgi:arylsulfatase A-like enzyme
LVPEQALQDSADQIWDTAIQDSASWQDSVELDSAEPDSDPIVDPRDSILQFSGGLPRNLLVISLDTLRLDRIGFFDGSMTTPFLDGRLRESVVLTDLRGCSNWTYSSLLCLFTGQSTVDLGFEPVTADALAPSVPDRLDMLPLWLRQAGFRTTVVGGSPFLSPEPGIITAEGFQTVVYDDWGGDALFPPAKWTIENGLDQAARLREDPETPWYLHLHFMDPHSPFDAPESYRADIVDLDPIPYDLTNAEQYGQAQRDYQSMSEDEKNLVLAHMDAHYRGDIRYLDDQLAGMWKGLDALGALDDTLVLFWSDHGEQYWDHNQLGHGMGLYQEENRTLGAFWAWGLERGLLHQPAQHQDLAPTLLTVFGVRQPGSITGLPLRDIAADRLRTAFRYNSGAPARFMVSRENQVLFYSGDGKKYFHDAKADPLELRDIYDVVNPDLIALWDDMDEQIDRVLGYLPHLEIRDPGP